ncbi:hypothetical protein [Phnomibacter sp. MR]|uniref:hypothetical protein n=1 Tax=Phnomibacter sp. MR TaxID=3042318 RepID=UPI003A7FC063
MNTENTLITDTTTEVAVSDVQAPLESVQATTAPVETDAAPEPGTVPAPGVVSPETTEPEPIAETTEEPVTVALPEVAAKWEKPQKKTTKKTVEEKPLKLPTRATRTVAFSIAEDEYIQQIFEARLAAGLSENMNQMLRQALNFAFNHEPGWVFGVPKNIKKIHFVK